MEFYTVKENPSDSILPFYVITTVAVIIKMATFKLFCTKIAAVGLRPLEMRFKANCFQQNYITRQLSFSCNLSSGKKAVTTFLCNIAQLNSALPLSSL